MEWIFWIVSLLAAFAVGFFLTRAGIPFLKKKRMGQMILEIGPQWHKKKEGTPTMGGIFFTLAALIAFLACGLPLALSGAGADPDFLYVLLFMLCHGLIGFADDYVKFIHHENKGFTAWQKLVLQFAVTAAFLWALTTTGHLSTALVIPFSGGKTLELGLFYYLIVLVFAVGFINAVNLTDGLDGLAGSNVGVVLLLFFLLFLRRFLSASAREDAVAGVLYLAVLGGVLAFLVFNHHPAKIFMGDTGSLFLGAALAGAALWLDFALILLPAGIVFFWEAISDMLQVGYFKLTHGKRIFKMAPFHHHLEKCGMTENQIVALFLAFTTAGCIAAWFA